jgi:hypothetical protein
MIAELQTGLNGDLVRSLPVNALPTSANGWPPRPFQIVSLLDVIQFPADQFLRASALLTALIEGLSEVSPSIVIADDLRQSTRSQLEAIKRLCVLTGLAFSVDEINFILSQRVDDPKETYIGLRALLDSLTRRMEDEARRGTYLFMPAADAKYYYDHNVRGSKRCFSDSVASAFPSAVLDLDKGGQAYAAGCDTACVFHMMRALEHGLRAMAQALRVKFPGKPIEYQTWADVIKEISKKVAAIESKPRTKKRDADVEFYGSAAAQFHFFKSAWRNHVMHSRLVYEHEDAAIVMRHTLEFMEHIAVRLKERAKPS